MVLLSRSVLTQPIRHHVLRVPRKETGYLVEVTDSEKSIRLETCNRIVFA